MFPLWTPYTPCVFLASLGTTSERDKGYISDDKEVYGKSAKVAVCVEYGKLKNAGRVPDNPKHLSVYNLYICYVFGVSELHFYI